MSTINYLNNLTSCEFFVEGQSQSIKGFSNSKESPDSQLTSNFPKFCQLTIDKIKRKQLTIGLDKTLIPNPILKNVFVYISNTFSTQTIKRLEDILNQFLQQQKQYKFLIVNHLDLNQSYKEMKKLQTKIYINYMKLVNVYFIRLQEFTSKNLQLLDSTQEEINALNESKKLEWKDRPFALKNVSCYDFTLFAAEEPGVAELLFTFIPNSQHFFDLLRKWGYLNVDNRQKGDLILYFNQNNLKHMALYLGEGMVLSKLGNESPFCTIHPIHLMTERYGNEMAFYRKVFPGFYPQLSKIKKSFFKHVKQG